VWLYNEFKPMFPKDTGLSETTSNLICSSAGYAISAVVTTPFDVIKTRKQIQTSNPELFNYTGAFDILQKTLKHEGAIALFDGCAGRVAWLTPRCALAMTFFEIFAKALSNGPE
jgi:solute carrier family 25 protein 39/40